MNMIIRIKFMYMHIHVLFCIGMHVLDMHLCEWIFVHILLKMANATIFLYSRHLVIAIDCCFWGGVDLEPGVFSSVCFSTNNPVLMGGDLRNQNWTDINGEPHSADPTIRFLPGKVDVLPAWDWHERKHHGNLPGWQIEYTYIDI